MSSDSQTKLDAALEQLFYQTDRVQLIYWQVFSGAKLAVFLTGAVTILTFITGLSDLSRSDVTFDGPLAAVIPGDPSVLLFTGVLLAFVLVPLVFGLQQRKRLAWYLTLLILPLVTLLPLATFGTTDVPLLLLCLVTIPLLVVNRHAFDQRIDLSGLQIASLSSIVGVVLYGAIGSYTLRNQFIGLETWGDALYYVIVTIATVGYGDITPITTGAKWFSVSVIFLGTGAFTAAIGVLVVPTIEKRMAAAFGNMTPSELSLLEDHVLVLGYSDITESLLEELAGEIDVAVVTPDSNQASDLDDREINVLTADPADVETLHDARINDARGVVVATRDDAQDVLTILATRKANSEVQIVAAANDRKHIDKFEEVGADVVISPTEIGGRILGQSILEGRSTVSLFESEKRDEDDAG